MPREYAPSNLLAHLQEKFCLANITVSKNLCKNQVISAFFNRTLCNIRKGAPSAIPANLQVFSLVFLF